MLTSLAGCMVGEPPSSAVLAPELPRDVFDTLNPPTAAHAELCDHPADDLTFPDQADRITNRFCQDVKLGGAMPTPHSLAELLKLLDLDFKDPAGGNGVGGNPAFAILGHSSALTARTVSSITPTAFVFTPLGPDGTPPADYMFLAYDPGEPFVEVASFSPADQAVNFYLVEFDKDCTNTAAGCGFDDLLTPNQNIGWSNVRIYESTTSLNNTIADCRQCHIGTGRDVPDTGDPLILRMQEIEAPHTHWFSPQTDGGKALLSDFHAAHGTAEDYGPIPAAMIDKSDPALMAAFITAAGFGDQPNVFHSAQIEREVASAAPQQPANNVPIGESNTWRLSFREALAGQFIPVPYHDVKVTDPDQAGAHDAAVPAVADGQERAPRGRHPGRVPRRRARRDGVRAVARDDRAPAARPAVPGVPPRQARPHDLPRPLSRRPARPDEPGGEGSRDRAHRALARHAPHDAAAAVPHAERPGARADDRGAAELG